MELTANIWPVMDPETGVVLRFLARAYAFDASDDVISHTLRALAPADFRLARSWPIPSQFELVSEHGSIRACVLIDDFRKHQATILEAAFRDLEADFAKFQAIAIDKHGELRGIGLMPRFPSEPYLLFTTLLETDDGQLVPFIRPE